MNVINGFLSGLKQMVESLNEKAGRAMPFDPLQEISFKLEVGSEKADNRIAPAERLPLLVRITASYLSGGGIESSYAMNDEVSFSIGAEGIDNIIFARDMENIDQPPLDLGEVSLAKFIVRIESFLSVIIPDNELGPPV